MAQAYSNRNPRRSQYPRRRRGVGGRVVFIAVAGMAAFAVGFILLWSLGSFIVGGGGFPGGSDDAAAPSPAALPVDTDWTIEPLVDLRAFRDLSYVPVKGVYVTSDTTAYPPKFDALIDLADNTEINAFVIDLKDDRGYVTYNADVPLVGELGLKSTRIEDIDALLATLAEHKIIPIARIVCFKDSILAKAKPELAVRNINGGMWEDNKGLNYINPYNHEVWEYLVEVAEDAARHGFREIQFDYVRFPTDGKISECVYPGEYSSKSDCIAGFLAYARERLEKLGVWVSADVFGLVVQDTPDAERIGQKIEKLSANVDIVCPMVYPSHYNTGSYEIDNPNSEPYDLVSAAMKEAATRLAGTGAMGRPWLQDFSMRGIAYGVAEVKAEIKAAEEQGFDEWILWNASNNYTEGALRGQGAE